MRPFGGSLSVVDVDELFSHGFVEGGGTDVGIGELMCFGAGAEPHFGNVEAHGFAGGGEEGFYGGLEGVVCGGGGGCGGVGEGCGGIVVVGVGRGSCGEVLIEETGVIELLKGFGNVWYKLLILQLMLQLMLVLILMLFLMLRRMKRRQIIGRMMHLLTLLLMRLQPQPRSHAGTAINHILRQSPQGSGSRWDYHDRGCRIDTGSTTGIRGSIRSTPIAIPVGAAPRPSRQGTRHASGII